MDDDSTDFTGQPVDIIFIIGLVILVLTGATSYLTARKFMEVSKWVTHTNEVLTGIKSVVSVVAEAESSQRGYLLTRAPVFLQEYKSATASIQPAINYIATLTRDSQTQQDKINMLRGYADSRITTMAKTLASASPRRADRLSSEIERNNAISADIKALLHAMEKEEDRLLGLRIADEHLVARNSVLVTVFGSLLSLILVVTAIRIMKRDLEIKERTQRELMAAREKALEASQLKSQFLANMSHEIRTPMNGVIGIANILSETALDNDQQNYVNMILQSANSLLTIINDILDFSKIESGKLDLETIDFDLGKVVRNTIEVLKYSAKHKNIDLAANVDPLVANWLRGDPGRLRQIMTNVISNAIKFTEKGGVTLNITMVREEGTAVVLRFEIQDTGIGIPVEALDRIFNAFAQADSSTTRRYGGTGLGLSISRRLIEMMRGKLKVESKVGLGSKFSFEATFEQGSADTAKLIETEKSPARGNRGDARVLIVEDNPINQKVATKMLQKMGYVTSVAGDGREALNALEENRFDLILLDCHMPNMDGYECATAIRKLNDAPYNHIPIIAMTANAIKGDRERCLAAGMDDYVSKPIDSSALDKIINRWLAKSNVRPTASTNRILANSAGNDEGRAIDRSALDILRELQDKDDPNLVGDLIKLFVGTTPDRLSKMKSAITGANANELALCAHSLKSSSANLGARQMRELCDKLENLGNAGTCAGAPALFSQLEKEFERARTELQTYSVAQTRDRAQAALRGKS